MSLNGETQLTTHLALWWLCMMATLDAVLVNENDKGRIRDMVASRVDTPPSQRRERNG